MKNHTVLLIAFLSCGANCYAQAVAAPSTLDFGAISLGLKAAAKQSNITSTTAGDTITASGPDIDEFQISTASCTDHQLKNSQCKVQAGAAGAAPGPIQITVSFTPHSTTAATAWVYVVNNTGASTRVLTLNGSGSYEVEVGGSSGCQNLYSDCDENAGFGFSIIGGFEQSYLSSEQNQTNGFIRAFTKVNVPLSDNWSVGPWAIIRDLGAPSANSNQNLSATINNPDGTITSSSLSSIGYSVDFLVGFGADRKFARTNGEYSLGPIIAFGATTPISSSSATVGYQVPPLGTEECTELQSRFASKSAYSLGYSPDLIAGTQGTSTPPNQNCLFNVANGGNTPVTTLAFSGVNRSNFLLKWDTGIRSIYRSHTSSTQTTCDPTNPCQRGVVDLTVGQDASLAGGKLRHFMFKAEGVQPFPYSGGYLYIFGTMALRFQRNSELPPLILAAAPSSALQSIPSASVFVEPFMQPNKDFYRIGVGISADKIFNSLKH